MLLIDHMASLNCNFGSTQKFDFKSGMIYTYYGWLEMKHVPWAYNGKSGN